MNNLNPNASLSHEKLKRSTLMAYAALSSLRSPLWRVNVRKLTESKRYEFDSLIESLEQLDDERYRGIDMSEINELDAKIKEAAWKLEDVIESYQISQGPDDEGLVEQEVHSFFNTANKLREEYDRVLQNLYFSQAAAVSVKEEDDIIIIHDAANSTTVGLSDLSQQIVSALLDDESEIKMYAIWGMAGIGKTHLARDIYHHPLIVQHFDLRLWVTVGQIHESHIKNIYVAILAQIEHKPRDVFTEKDTLELRDLIYTTLLHRTYFIVLDDIWIQEVLNGCKDALPCQNEQRILVTTRIRHSVGIRHNKVWEMPFLSDEESWELLSQNVFANKPVPTLLEKPGRKIAQLCEGLPLLILTVADILRDLDQTQEFWNKVAEKKTTTFPDAFDRIYEVLILSYDYLSQQCKAPFLYMGIFPQGHVILVSKLLNLWMIENFNDYSLKIIVSSSLAIVCKLSSSSKLKSCKLHCTYWYVCVTEAKKNGLFHVLNKLSDVFIESPRRLAVQNNMLFGIKAVHDSMAASTSLTRSLLFTGDDHQYPVEIPFNTMLLLKVLDALAIRFYEFPNEVVNLLLLSYLALTHNGELPSSISKLQWIEVLILRRHHNIKLVESESTTYLPNEIWDLQKLKYLRIVGSKLPDPNRGKDLPRLSRLYVNADSCTEGVLRGTPTLRKLGIEIELQPEGGIEKSLRCLESTGIPHYLESVKCVVMNPRLSSQVVGRPVHHLSNLPRNLTKLSLKGLGYPWKYMSIIGSVPFLKVLKLRCSAFRGPKWEIKSGEFRSLTYLLLEDIDVMYWTVESLLEKLKVVIIRHCYKLNSIPFRDFSNMEKLEVDECSPSLVEFAQKIKEDPSPCRCKVVINSSWNL